MSMSLIREHGQCLMPVLAGLMRHKPCLAGSILVIACLLLLSCAPTVNIQEPIATDNVTKPGVASISEDDRNDYRNAITALNKNELVIAEKILNEIVKKHGTMAGPWANLALVYYKQNKIDNAVKLLEKSLELNPKQPQSLNLLGVIELKKGNAAGAMALYQSAISSKPDYALAHYNLAYVYDIYYRDTPKAVEHYRQYLAITDHQDKETVALVDQLVAAMSQGH